jgi:putative aldouronate transport system permease protein
MCILPLLHILAVSFSGKAPASAGMVVLWPIDFTLHAYTETINNPHFLSALNIAVERTVFGTSLSMIVVILAAYPLSKEYSYFRSRTAYVWFFVFTMLFSGGIIPSYILILNLGLMNTLWALILPGAVSVWNLILLLNFFRTVPRELEEAALIDGAGHLKTALHIYLPISMPAIATLSLFAMVGHWNSWFDGLLYLKDTEKYPLATFLQMLIVQQDFANASINIESLKDISERTVKAAQIFIGALPILLVYPFLQRYFVKGIVLGSVKE